MVAADALIARPIGLGLTIAGTGLFLVTLPMSAISGSTDTAAEGLIVKPGGYTFVRPFGSIDPRFEEKDPFRALRAGDQGFSLSVNKLLVNFVNSAAGFGLRFFLLAL